MHLVQLPLLRTNLEKSRAFSGKYTSTSFYGFAIVSKTIPTYGSSRTKKFAPIQHCYEPCSLQLR
jgi:hypothetical protein